jgi:methyltransferase (TIGR00027 family)
VEAKLKEAQEHAALRSARITCACRACSAMEVSMIYRTDDHLARWLLPGSSGSLFRSAALRRLFAWLFAPNGIYEYIIARTRYMDAAFRQACSDRFDQILMLGAGFDTRALRFQDMLGRCVVYELDLPLTLQAKTRQVQQRGIPLPSGLKFIGSDLETDSFAEALGMAGFQHQRRTLFMLEGLLVYLQPGSVDALFRRIREHAGASSRLVFDCPYYEALAGKRTYYGETRFTRLVTRSGQRWHFGILEGQHQKFLAAYELRCTDFNGATELEQAFFREPGGKLAGRINATHCLITAEYP